MNTKGVLVGLGMVLLGALLLAAPISSNLSFSWNCEEYLKRAADSASPEKCGEELDKAIEYAKDNNLTKGNTGIFFKTPSCDIKFWFENLEKAREALKEVEPTGGESKATAMEKSNVLMRVRETLLDSANKGVEVTLPPRIELYPHVLMLSVLFWVGLIIGLLGIIVGVACIKD
jgi:hypothetical protein